MLVNFYEFILKIMFFSRLFQSLTQVSVYFTERFEVFYVPLLAIPAVFLFTIYQDSRFVSIKYFLLLAI